MTVSIVWSSSGRYCEAEWSFVQRPSAQLTHAWGTALPTTIYGIKNCDTMKKARAWLDANGVAYNFHDYKTAGVDKEKLKAWSDKVGWETLLNRAGTTFRKLPDEAKENLDERKAIDLMLEQPSMIKRPVLERGKTLLVGFSPEKYSELK